MARRTNKYGRTDYIPSQVRLQIRQQCGFGCVNCGSPFYDYEHWNPPFAELDQDPSADGITLCCPNCHRKIGGLISIDEYHANIAKPKARQDGFVATRWSKGFAPEIVLGNVKCSGGTKILEIDGELMLGFFEPEEEGTPPRLKARFFDRKGRECFRIDDNQCVGNPDTWDLTSNKLTSGGWKWRVRSGSRQIDLDLDVLPPDQIVVNRMRWQKGPLRVVASNNGLQVSLSQAGDDFMNLLFLYNASVKSRENDHSFLGIETTTEEATVHYHLLVSNIEIVGDGATTRISTSRNAPIITS